MQYVSLGQGLATNLTCLTNRIDHLIRFIAIHIIYTKLKLYM